MAAGLGFKDFTTGEVLTAADVDGYLMQGVWVFASAAARDAAVTSPQEGNFAYLKDTNVTTYYTGSAWANLDTTGMTNPMTTTGDVIYSSSGSTPARLGIGTAGQVLQVNSGATAPEWAAPAGGGKVLQVVMGTYALETAAGGATWVDTGLTATITPSSASSTILVMGVQTGVAKTANDTRVGLRIVRTSTEINKFCQQALYGATDSVPYGSEAFAYLDSPSTTSATTYKTQQNNSGSNGQTRTQWQDVTTSTILLLEIGA